ncbi:DUF1292 domain-containing protein [bacterium]|nr:DUF1292 domain-containing protein [bacterium]
MEKKEDKFIETYDEAGNKVTFELIDIVTVDDIEFALLLPEDSTEEDEIIVMRLKKDGEDYSFESIEDDDEFDRVAQYIEEIEDETEE